MVLLVGVNVSVGGERLGTMAAWRDVVRSLVERHVGTPIIAVIDGSAGLAAALREQWPTLAIQRRTAHELRNLEAKAPMRLREELAEGYRRMIYAESRAAVEQVREWRLRCPAVVEGLEEAGDDLFTFLRFPKLRFANVADERMKSGGPGNLDGTKYPWRTFWRRCAI